MATEAQIEANRRNAQRSTGPRTPEGKKAASCNALRHGLTARQVIVFDESGEDFARFHDEMREALAPTDAIEEQIVERIVLCAWRLRRASRAEAALMNARARKWQEWKAPDNAHAGAVFEEPQKMGALTRHEAAIERALHRAYALLEQRRLRADGRTAENENCKTKPIPLAPAAAAAPSIEERSEERQEEVASPG